MANIEHVIVLMLENRSFDHLLGLFSTVDGIKDKQLVNLLDPSAPVSSRNPSFPARDGATWTTVGRNGPSHSLPSTTEQIYGTKAGPTNGGKTNIGFVENYSTALLSDHIQATPDILGTIMRAFEVGRLSALHTLATEFAICDYWYAEVPGPTMPNRWYIHAGTSAGYAHNDWKREWDLPTIYNRLEDKNKTWAVYFSDQNDVANFTSINTRRQNFRLDDTFAADAKAARLPNYTFIVPQFFSSQDGQPVNSMHAPQDLRPGDVLIADTYNAVRSNDAAWGKTLLIVTFDEHGGFFDHVLPPKGPNPDGINSPAPGDTATYQLPVFDFSRLGLRVPTILASPWIPKGKIISTQLQHTSVLATLRELWGVASLTKRDQGATSLLPELSETARTDTITQLPRLPALEGALANASLSLRDPHHPANQLTDETQDEIVEGWQDRMRRVLPNVRQSVLPVMTHGAAHEFVRSSVLRYLDARAQKRK